MIWKIIKSIQFNLTFSLIAKSLIIGSKILAGAELVEICVRQEMMMRMMKRMATSERESSLVSCWPIISFSPDLLVPSAMAKPPPIRMITPQGSLKYCFE